MPSGAEYSHLHNLLVQHQDIQDKLARGPKVIANKQKLIEAAEANLTEKEAELKEARAAVDKKNLDLKSKESQQGELQGKLNAASSNREYDIISGQIAADKAATAVLEDEILELMDRVDTIQQEIVDCKTEIAQAEADAAEYASNFEKKAEGLKQDASSLKQQIEDAEQIIPSEIREQYRRLVSSYGPDAMASTAGGACNSCFVSVTAQNQVALNSGQSLFCGSCGRLLYNE